MNKNHLQRFREMFDPVLTADGYVRRYGVYWHMNVNHSWFYALWPKSVGQGRCFEIQFDLGPLWQLAPEAFKKKQYESDYSLELAFARQTGPIYTLWSVPKDYQTALDLYRQKARAAFGGLHTLDDLYRLERKLRHSDMVTLSDGARWIEMLVWLGKTKEAASLVPFMQKWAEDLTAQLEAEEAKYRQKLKAWQDLEPLPKRLLATEPSLCQTELERIPQRAQRLQDLRHQISAIEQRLNGGQPKEWLQELTLRNDKTISFLKTAFSKKEIEWMQTPSSPSSAL